MSEMLDSGTRTRFADWRAHSTAAIVDDVSEGE
jgi:hypothetical protein